MIMNTLNKNSPWITNKDNSLFGYEITIAKDKSYYSFLKPHPLFLWLVKRKSDNKLFEALAELCPLQPLISYNGDTSIWLSPPLSGLGNSVGIIIGKRKKNNKWRIIGTNSMSGPLEKTSRTSIPVFDAFDAISNDPMAVTVLIQNEISSRMGPDDILRSQEIEYEARKYRTMAIYILVIDGDKSCLAIDTAVVTGNYPADMSLEYAGEIK